MLGKIYRDARDREWVDKLNTLYVALTRAQYELYIVGVKGKRANTPSTSWRPCSTGTARTRAPPGSGPLDV